MKSYAYPASDLVHGGEEDGLLLVEDAGDEAVGEDVDEAKAEQDEGAGEELGEGGGGDDVAWCIRWPRCSRRHLPVGWSGAS